jgi:type III restriction enzyme
MLVQAGGKPKSTGTQRRKAYRGLRLGEVSRVQTFAKNAGLGFSIPYMHNGQPHDYLPDFIVRLAGDPSAHLILETKGYDELAEIKAQAAERWANAVNVDGSYGVWRYAMAREPKDFRPAIEEP